MKKGHRTVTAQASLPWEALRLVQKLVLGLRFENRFTLDGETENLVSEFLGYAERHKTVLLPVDTPLWRARIHDMDDRFNQKQTAFSLEEMGAPPPINAAHGRLNPKGIPYLYLSSDELTCVSEVRAWKGAKLTVAEFSLTKEAKLVDLREFDTVKQSELGERAGAELAWSVVAGLFSIPFDARDDTAYIPSQYLAERIKRTGYHGIQYTSSLYEGGYNVAFFDTGLAIPLQVKVMRVESIRLTAQEISSGDSTESQ